MSAKINVIGKSREQIACLLATKRTAELLDIIYDLATLEPHYSPREVAQARGLTKSTIVKLIHDGKLRGVFVPTDRGDFRISRSGVLDFDRRTELVPLNNGAR